MPKKHLEDDFSHIPNVAYVSPLELKPNRVLIGLGVAAIVIALGTLGYLLVDKLFLGESATAVPNIEITKKSPTTKAATPSDPKSETADWKTYKNTKYNFSLKYPDEYILNNLSDPETDEGKLSETRAKSIVFLSNPADLLKPILVLLAQDKKEYITSEGLEKDFSGLSLKEIVQKLKKDEESRVGNEVSMIKETTVGNSMAFYFDVSQNPEISKEDIYSRVLLIRVDDDRFIEMNFTPDDIFIKIVSTFKFLD